MLKISDVEGKKFTTTRLREGYEIAEVDRFLAEVVEALTARDKVISVLQDQLEVERDRSAAQAEAATAAVAEATADRATTDHSVVDDDPRRQNSVAAARLLEIATVNAEQLVTEAKNEADSLVGAARAEAEQLVTASRTEADRVTAELAQHKEQQEAELEQHRTTVLTEVADAKAAIEAKIDGLQQLESDNRDRLRAYFADQLAQLEDTGPAVKPFAFVD